MYHVMRPGKGFCVDECRSEFTGDDVEYDEELKGLPHETKIARKSKSVGIEAKCIADIESGILLKFELMEGKEAMRAKPYAAQYGAGTAFVLRLSEPWRVVVATL